MRQPDISLPTKDFNIPVNVGQQFRLQLLSMHHIKKLSVLITS